MANRKSANDGAMEDRTYRIKLEGEIDSYLMTQRLLEARRSQHTELENYVWPSTRRGLPPATYTSANWSGVVEVGNFGTSSSFDNMFSVSGQFAVPGVDVPGGATCPNTGTVYIAAQWVGLGGAQPQLATPGDQVLYQAGVDEEWDCSKGTSGKRTYYAWWEDFHADNNGGSAQYMQRLNGYGVTAGDVISVTVSYPSVYMNGSATPTNTPTLIYDIRNMTKGWEATNASSPYTDPEGKVPLQTAEAIIERLCGACNPAGPPFSPVSRPASSTFSFTGLTMGINAAFASYQNANLNEAFTVAFCLDNQEQQVDCADPQAVNLKSDYCDKATLDTQSETVNSINVDYHYNNVPDYGSPPTLCDYMMPNYNSSHRRRPPG